jgi:hypothetical protein
MLKIYLCFIICLITLSSLKSQTVEIPDPALRAFLKNQFPDCFDWNEKLDTTCSAILSATGIRMNKQSVSSLNGLQYFDSLTNIEVFNSSIDTVNFLPPSLNSLYITNCKIKAFESLPPALTVLTCYSNSLKKLPAIPVKLESLICYSNQLDSLPLLPGTLKFLDCRSNYLKGLPALPTSLRYLDYLGNTIRQPGLLPDSLVYLNCSSNQTDTLPQLPPNLKEFIFVNNNITTIPALPSRLEHLDGRLNKITTLPHLPELKQLYLEGNQISTIEKFPESLQIIDIAANPILCLPVLPSALEELYLDTTITCLPNEVSGLLIYENGKFSGFAKVADRIVCDSSSAGMCGKILGYSSHRQKSPAALYPNPVTSHLFFKTPTEGMLTLINSLGEEVFRARISGNTGTDLTEVAPGIYQAVLNGISLGIIVRQ